MPSPESSKRRDSSAIPDQLIQIAHEQEGGAERIISQMEVVQNSFEEIQSLTRECQEVLARLVPPSDERQELIDRMESIAVHANNGIYNVQGAYDLFQYQDIVRQKLEKVGHRLIEVSEFVLNNLNPTQAETRQSASAGRDILERDAQGSDSTKNQTDAVIAEFFAKIRANKAAQGK
jgi:predicted  nucleic acid-binding Zn-ribbon protein